MALSLWSIESLDDLLLLQRSLLEARFSRDPVDPVLLGSPRLGELHRDVVLEIIRQYEARADDRQVDAWRKWRLWDGRTRERALVRERLVGGNFMALDRVNQVAYLAACVQPFDATAEDIDRFLEEILGLQA
jgi:hypothetical protein